MNVAGADFRQALFSQFFVVAVAGLAVKPSVLQKPPPGSWKHKTFLYL